MREPTLPPPEEQARRAKTLLAIMRAILLAVALLIAAWVYKILTF